MGSQDVDVYAEEGQMRVLLYTGTVRQADEFRQVLEDHDILAVVGDEDDEVLQPGAGGDGNIPLLVSAPSFEEAREVIAECEDALGFEFDDEGELCLTRPDNRDFEFMHEDTAGNADADPAGEADGELPA